MASRSRSSDVSSAGEMVIGQLVVVDAPVESVTCPVIVVDLCVAGVPVMAPAGLPERSSVFDTMRKL